MCTCSGIVNYKKCILATSQSLCIAFPQHVMRTNALLSTGKSSKQTQHVSACLLRDGDEENAVPVVKEKSDFDSSSSCCGGSGADIELVVVVADVVLVVVDILEIAS